MKRTLGKLLTLCLLMVGGGLVVHAQIESVPQIYANVPFAFVVGDTKLPAGKYEIGTPEFDSPNLLEIRSPNRHTSVFFDTAAAQTRGDKIVKKTELVFDKVGDQYFLTQIWVSGSASGSELPKSRMEKRLANDGAAVEKHSVVAFLKQLKR